MTKMPFRKLGIWNKGVELVKEVYGLTKKFPKDELFGLTSQVRRAAVSIPSNIAEGSQRSSDKDFRHFVLIARGSLAELETQLLISVALGYVVKKQTETCFEMIDELHRMLYAFTNSLSA